MAISRALEQHIAVFGESGSGKTVLLSSFYGASQQPENIKESGFNVITESSTQGTQLLQNYLGMKKSGRLPDANKFSAKAFSFLIKLKSVSNAAAVKGKAFEALRLVWHDYPGEWFEQDVSGPAEEQRRVETFRTLLSSDVALLLVDGEQFAANLGEEKRYLKSLLTNFQNQLLLLKPDLLPDSKPLVRFPRIWILALSKADLLPDLKVSEFRDILIEQVGSDINELRGVLAEFMQGSEALSVGEDFVLLSSAKFDVTKANATKIELTDRVGVDLILPLAAVLPLERHLKWAETVKLPRKVAVELMSNADEAARALDLGAAFLVKHLPARFKAVGAVASILSRVGVQLMAVVLETLNEADKTAQATESNLLKTLAGFRSDLNNGEEDQILLLSPQ